LSVSGKGLRALSFRLWALGFGLVIPTKVGIQSGHSKSRSHPDSNVRGNDKAIAHSCFVTCTLILLSVALFTPNPAGAFPVKALRPPRIPALLSMRQQLPGRDTPIRIAALRVEFVRDTLSTTTGGGAFRYAAQDSFYTETPPDTIYFDPPPHDSLYFADHLQFQQFYWNKMSNGSVSFTWDIYPGGAQAAYPLPKQIWQYNYNNGAAQLDKGLAELFRDAIQSADRDPYLNWSNYDLVIIFHAGAGAEFDLGFSSTPHDLPSAWMVKNDFAIQLGLPDGIPVENGARFIEAGLILPETETHEGVQISMAGVLTLMIGHWMNLPALYDRDNGGAVVGKWSMMDRGFGNFYGALPGPVDAWSASYMGWKSIDDAIVGGNRVASRFHVYVRFPEDPIIPEALRIPITDEESFILEARFRDPEDDSVAFAFDRDGRRMTFHDNYTVTVEDGFRVPVRADDLDFDSPGSGILLWHQDNGLETLIPEGRFNSVNELRGLDLEEADGAQDIGRDYPFLTPGWGTDYGINDDAWYGDNVAHRTANQGRLTGFRDDSYPNSRTNTGAYSHTLIDSISRRQPIMGFRLKHPGFIYQISPASFANGSGTGGSLVTGNLDEDTETEEFALFSSDYVRLFRMNGTPYDSIPMGQIGANRNRPGGDHYIARDFNGDDRLDILWASDSLYSLTSQPINSWSLRSIDSVPLESWNGLLAVGGEGFDASLLLVSANDDTTLVTRYSAEYSLQSRLGLPSNAQYAISLHRLGDTASDSFLIVTSPAQAFISTRSGIRIVVDSTPYIDATYTRPALLADFDGSGSLDLMTSAGEGVFIFTLCKDIFAPNSPPPVYTRYPFSFGPGLPRDVNDDGRWDITGVKAVGEPTEWCEDIAISPDGILLEGYPHSPTSFTGTKTLLGDELAALSLGNGDHLIIRAISREILYDRSHNPGKFGTLLNAQLNDGSSLPGYPVELNGWPVQVRFAQIDTISGYDILVTTDSTLYAFSLPTSRFRNQSIWWQGPYRDNDHSNAVWEPATPFSPASGELMPDDLCYNWPNPARGESTAIRYTLNYAAQISVEIFDIAGDKVASLKGSGEAGLPGEIIWDVRDVARGAYLAIVKAEGAGKSDQKTVKIAVVK
jgi:M6 family metalloprotease-like protein